jgi:ubiquinone/menaquinone biosynthesis C-methylase UbiE
MTSDKKRMETIETLNRYYDEKADLYLSSYTGDGRYPSNKFRLKIALNLIEKSTGRKILDAGCGNGIAGVNILRRGYDWSGFDISGEMIKRAKELLRSEGLDPDRVFSGDVFHMSFPDRTFDKVLLLGVLQHLPEHEQIFSEIHRVLKTGGDLIVSMDNSLFSLFTLNQYTVKFLRSILEHYQMPADQIEACLGQYGELIQFEKVVSVKKSIQTSIELDNKGTREYDYNPLNVHDKFRAMGFRVRDIRFYHYHPLPPRFENRFEDIFASFAQGMESVEYDWRGAILCNQFVVRAKAMEFE